MREKRIPINDASGRLLMAFVFLRKCATDSLLCTAGLYMSEEMR